MVVALTITEIRSVALDPFDDLVGPPYLYL